jgi:hypothetical protein
MFRPVHGVKQTCGKSQDNESENESGRQVRKESKICFSLKERKSKKISRKNSKKICCSFEKRKYLSWILFRKEQETNRGN